VSTLQDQIAAVVNAEFAVMHSIASMKDRGVPAESIDYWTAQLDSLVAARQTLRLLLNEARARRELEAHILIAPDEEAQP